jgi:RNA polymerase sigma factor FliA
MTRRYLCESLRDLRVHCGPHAAVWLPARPHSAAGTQDEAGAPLGSSDVGDGTVTIDRHEQDALIAAHLPLVGYHVSEMIRRVPAHVQREDLAAAGSLALVQAARAFNPDLGVPFARYAALRVRGAMVDELRSMDWAPRATRHRARQLNEVRDRLTAALSRTPTREELAEALGADVGVVDAAQGDVERRVLSLDAESAVSAENVASSELSPEERLLVDERLRYLGAAITELPDRLRTVIEGVYLHDRPVSELADELGVTQSRISQLRSQALQLLKDGMNAALEPGLAPAVGASPGVAERRRQAYYASVAARGASVITRARAAATASVLGAELDAV